MSTSTMTPMDHATRIETIARACHEANRAWCVAHGDDTQQPWDDAEGWQRSSAMEGVQVAINGATPAQLHESWCNSKEDDGWVYGRVKDAGVKTHPCLVPYADLPAFQKIKDDLFGAVVRALAPPLGFDLPEA